MESALAAAAAPVEEAVALVPMKEENSPNLEV